MMIATSGRPGDSLPDPILEPFSLRRSERLGLDLVEELDRMGRDVDSGADHGVLELFVGEEAVSGICRVEGMRHNGGARFPGRTQDGVRSHPSFPLCVAEPVANLLPGVE